MGMHVGGHLQADGADHAQEDDLAEGEQVVGRARAVGRHAQIRYKEHDLAGTTPSSDAPSVVCLYASRSQTMHAFCYGKSAYKANLGDMIAPGTRFEMKYSGKSCNT